MRGEDLIKIEQWTYGQWTYGRIVKGTDDHARNRLVYWACRRVIGLSDTITRQVRYTDTISRDDTSFQINNLVTNKEKYGEKKKTKEMA